jgi:hydroxyacylglutathione hydrolase
MKIHIQVIRALQDNYCYLIWREGSGLCAVVDPSEAGPIEDALSKLGLKLALILNTHHHHDHVGGNASLVKAWQPDVYCSAVDAKRIPDASRGLVDGETFEFDGIGFKTLSIPGHTHGQIAFLIHEAKAIFVGDTLFSMGCGRLFEGTPEQMWRSLNRILSLPQDFQIYFGHEYTERNGAFARNLEPDNMAIVARLRETRESLSMGRPPSAPTISDEMKVNPFLRARSASIRRTLSMPNASDVEVFASLRRLRDEFRG